MNAILAVNKLGYIGKDNKLLWHSKEDLKHLKAMVKGCKCLVGSKTFENMPKLKDVEFIVVGKNYNTLEEALLKEPQWCIGGAMILESVLHLITEFHLSVINNYDIGDVKLPNIDSIKNVIKYEFECV